MPSVNLIPQHRREAKRRRCRVRLWAGVVGVYALLLLVGVAAAHGPWGGPDQSVARDLREANESVRMAQEEIGALAPELEEARLSLRASRAVAIQPDWSVLLALLGELREEKVVLTRCILMPVRSEGGESTGQRARGGAAVQRVSTVEGGSGSSEEGAGEEGVRKPIRYRLEVGGIGREQRDVSRFVLRLERTGLFDRVKLLETNRYPFGERQMVGFRLDCRIGDAEGGS